MLNRINRSVDCPKGRRKKPSTCDRLVCTPASESLQGWSGEEWRIGWQACREHAVGEWRGRGNAVSGCVGTFSLPY